MKELKALLKTNKYLEAKAFILSNLDNIEECIDTVLDEMVQREPQGILCIKAKEIDQETINALTERLKEAKFGTYSYRLTDEPFPKVSLPINPAVGEHIPIIGVENNENFIKADPCNITHEGKKINCHISKRAQIGDENDVVDPKGLDFSYLKAQYDTPSEKLDTLIKEKIKPK